MTTSHIYLHLEQFLLRDNRRPTEQLLHNQGERDQFMKIGGRAIALWDLRELFWIRGAGECHCLHSPSTWIVQVGDLCRCSGRPTRLLVCVDWTTQPGPLLWLWTIASMGCCPTQNSCWQDQQGAKACRHWIAIPEQQRVTACIWVHWAMLLPAASQHCRYPPWLQPLCQNPAYSLHRGCFYTRPLFQDWGRQVLHLIHREKHKVKIGRQEHVPNEGKSYKAIS